jgi:hypothetical protein
MYNSDGKALCLMPDLPQKVLTNESDTSQLAATVMPGSLNCLILEFFFYYYLFTI